MESITDAILVLDKDGFIVSANKAATEITGYSSEQLKDQPFSIFYQKDDIKAGYEMNMAKKNGRFISEGWVYGMDQVRFWAEVTLFLIDEGRQQKTSYGCIIRNFSERKKKEIELLHREEQFRLMVEGVKDYAIFMLDTTGHIQTWNEGAQLTKGYSPDEIIGKHFSIFYTAEDLKINKPANELKIAIATGKYEEEGWRVRKNGSQFWANVVITALFNEQNKHIGFSKVTRDLTSRKYFEESLKQSEERYRSLVEQVIDYGIFMLDVKGRIASWNEGAKRIQGYTSEEIIGKYFTIFYPEEDIIKGKPAYELKIARAQGKYEEEGWRVRKNGDQFWASVVITAIYNHEGLLIGFSKVTRDLTEKIEAEKALRESYERYRALASELRQTNSELSYANEELEQFTSIVSHDLQEPVRTIKSFLQLMDLKLDNGQYDQLKNYIGKSIKAANRMRELILNLLQYSQLGKTDITKEKIQVQELMNEALQNLKQSIESSGAEIIFDTELETIYGDRIQLVQLIQNLVSNALKFTDAEKPFVKISCWEENGHARFAVSDNGIGIAETDLDKVFEIFRRLGTQKEYPGTGIGLAICKKIVDRHRGRIWPESEPGKGTTFYFTLNEENSERLVV